MKTYRVLTLQQVIEALRALPEAAGVVGIDGGLHSDRGYYERSASSPANWPIGAPELADELQGQVGKPTQGWKGGGYKVRLDLPVHVGDHGDTGPAIAGFERNSETGYYDIVAIEDTWY